MSHPYRNETGTGRLDVTIDAIGRGNQPVPAKVDNRTIPKDTFFDAAFIEASKEALTEGHLISPGQRTGALASSASLVLAANNDSKGSIKRPERGSAIVTITDYFPTHDFEDDVFGNMRAILRGRAEQSGVFFRGTSGSAWMLDGEIAGIQIAAEDSFRTGYAQAGFAIFREWLDIQFTNTAIALRSF
ncbi:MAG: hypothetical protein AAFX06_14180 [Planctomycetota bacterium]